MTTTKMKRVSQRELVNRVYDLRRKVWGLVNQEDQLTGNIKFDNGVRTEELVSKEWKPFYRVKRFDASVTIYSSIKNDLQNLRLESIFEVLEPNEYFVVRGIKYQHK